MDDEPRLVDYEQVEADAETCTHLRQVAALLAEFYDACKAAGLPDSLTATVVRDWHLQYISDGVAWDDASDA